MISVNLRFEGFDARTWTNLVSLFAPGVVEHLKHDPESSDAPEVTDGFTPHASQGSLVLIRSREGRLLKSFHTVRGRITDLKSGTTYDLPALCTTYGATRGMLVTEGVLEEVGEKLAMRLTRREDYVAQWLVLARILREMQEARLLEIWPRPLANVPVPSAVTVRRAFDILLPDDRAMILALWDDRGIWTAVVLRRQTSEVDLVAGPEALARWTGPTGGDWRRDYRVVADAVSHAVAPLHLGIFAHVRTMRTLLRTPDAGAWATAVALRDVILHPTPPYVGVALTADAVHGVARRTARLLGGLDLAATFAPLTQYVRSQVAEISSITATLGFDPLKALAQLLARSGAPGDEPPPSSVSTR